MEVIRVRITEAQNKAIARFVVSVQGGRVRLHLRPCLEPDRHLDHRQVGPSASHCCCGQHRDMCSQGVTVLTRRRLIALSAGIALAPDIFGRSACAQMQPLEWPNRVVRLIVPFAAGGPTDIVAEQLSKIWGQQVVIENRGGEFSAVARCSTTCDRARCVPNSSPAKSVMEFVAYDARAHPGKVTLASPGTGSTPHLAGELLKQMAKIEMTHVPYRGASPALNDLIPDRVDCCSSRSNASARSIMAEAILNKLGAGKFRAYP